MTACSGTFFDQRHMERGEMRAGIIDSDNEQARHRQAYRRQRDVLANATSAHLLDLLSADDELRRTAARDELLRRGERVST